MAECTICPRNCGIDRSKSIGYCKEKDEVQLARAALHMWEEPCISGENGSGAVFFSGCNLRCVYCQNFYIARGDIGRPVSVERLAEIFLSLQDQNANNINLVTPTHFVPSIIQALNLAKAQGLKLPIVYNTSGYESAETMKMLEGLIDIYLPDFKYLDPQRAQKYSFASDYPQTAKAALEEMYRQTGDPVFDEAGLMKKGIIVRHLLLPGGLRESRQVIRYLYETYGDHIFLSIMNQYTPLDTLDKEKYPELSRKVKKKAYDTLVDYAIDLGVTNAFIQEGEVASESFIPAFDYTGL